MAAAVPLLVQTGSLDEARPMAQRVIEQVAADPERTWLWDGGDRVTIAALLAEAEALAAAFGSLGLLPGDTISFQLPNWRESAAINLAAALCGLVVNPIVPIYRDAEVQAMLLDSAARLLLVPETFRNFDYLEMAERIRARTPELRHVVAVRGARVGFPAYEDLVRAFAGMTVRTAPLAADAAKLRLYTSGTTGRAKAVLHSQATIDRFIGVCARHWELKAGDAVLMPSPVTHITGYAFGLEMPGLVGSLSVLMDRWDAAVAIGQIKRHDIAMTVSATPFLNELVDAAIQADEDLPSLRIFGCGGAPVAPELIRRANRQFAHQPAFRVYGCSELPMIALARRGGDEPAAVTDGRPIDYEVKVVDDAGVALPPGAEGEILARGPAMFLGYADGMQTVEAMTPDGWFRSGDMGMLSTSGHLMITGRKKDLIIRGGENISSREIEEVLLGAPRVRDAAVVAMPHDRLGEGVCAVLVLETGGAVADVDAYVRAQGLAPQKRPERYEIVDALPINAAGKVRKEQLRARVRANIDNERMQSGERSGSPARIER